MRGGTNCRRKSMPPPLTLTLSPQERGEEIPKALALPAHFAAGMRAITLISKSKPASQFTPTAVMFV